MKKISDQVVAYLPTLGFALIVLAFGVGLTILIMHFVKKGLVKTKLDPSLILFFIRSIRFILYTLVAIIFLSELGISTTGLLAFFSAGLAAVALALKDNISDIASGIVILFTRPFVTGDFIEFGAYKGYVKKIDLIHTKLMTYDDTEVIVPNSNITKSEVNNYSSSPDIRVVINVPISYAADIDKTKEVLFNAAKSVDKTLTDEKHTPQIRLQKYGESSLDFEVRCWCDFKDYWPVYYQLTETVKKALDANNIPIPYNQLDVHIIDKK